MLSSIGSFFYIRGKLIYNSCPLSEGREQAGKLDNSYGHDQLYDAHFKTGEYIDYPRGRVVWDEKKIHSIIYIDPCINRENVLSQIIDALILGIMQQNMMTTTTVKIAQAIYSTEQK